MKNKIGYFIIFMVIISACGKKVITAHPDMIGTWEGNADGKSYTLEIKPDNKSTYTISSGVLSYDEYKGVARIKNDYLNIGFKKFKVNQYPTLNGNYYIMKIDDVTLSK
jgi:hypothetical protein